MMIDNEKYENLRKKGSKYAETFILTLLVTGIVSLFFNKFSIVVLVIYIVFLIVYMALSFRDHYYHNKPYGTRIFLHVLSPITLSGALFLCFHNIIRYIGKDIYINALWNSGVIFAFAVLSVAFSFMGANIYRILRVSTDPNKQVVYAATCIPIKKTENDEITFLLIKNESHSSSQWMFPGGHLKIEDNFVASKDNKCLDTLYDLPIDVAKRKCLVEANIKIDVIDFKRNEFINDTSLFSSDECLQTIAPIFNMLFLVSDTAKCYEHGHRIHYDFTYVARYKKQNNKRAKYESIEVNFRLCDFTFKNESKDMEIGIIGTKIHQEIGGGDIFKSFLSSIPLLIYETLKLFYENKERLNILQLK